MKRVPSSPSIAAALPLPGSHQTGAWTKTPSHPVTVLTNIPNISPAIQHSHCNTLQPGSRQHPNDQPQPQSHMASGHEQRRVENGRTMRPRPHHYGTGHRRRSSVMPLLPPQRHLLQKLRPHLHASTFISRRSATTSTTRQHPPANSHHTTPTHQQPSHSNALGNRQPHQQQHPRDA